MAQRAPLDEKTEESASHHYSNILLASKTCKSEKTCQSVAECFNSAQCLLESELKPFRLCFSIQSWSEASPTTFSRKHPEAAPHPNRTICLSVAFLTLYYNAQ